MISLSPCGKRALLGLVAIVAIALAAHTGRRHWAQRRSIPARGGKSMKVVLAGREPYYLQRDPRWAGDTLAPSRQTIGAVGCLVCSLAMGSEALGAPMDPGALNRRLGAEGGYTRQAWVIWEKVSAATGGAIEVTVHERPEHSIIDGALERGELPVVKLILPSGAPHWVLIVGKEGEDYLIKDPLMTDRAIVKLASRATSIVAVRVLRGATPPGG